MKYMYTYDETIMIELFGMNLSFLTENFKKNYA